ncbi:MAG: TIGR03757 family integrating conjugative element protein [gamma proteobacterium symbiont of Ctena orbiculata]|nr:MAG: TIGR03757 family integrating conjugative element protein [gamma proteobacterium symbiont of Ctena orbiculata]
MSISCFLTAALVFLFGLSTAYAKTSHQALLVEVFSTMDQVVQRDPLAGSEEEHQLLNVHVYELDGIRSFEAQLSSDLPVDPNHARQIALQRIQVLDEQAKAGVQNAAVGLAKAMQYGIDRYPAIVFDSKVVVYGVTDIGEALHRYQQWQEGQKR